MRVSRPIQALLPNPETDIQASMQLVFIPDSPRFDAFLNGTLGYRAVYPDSEQVYYVTAGHNVTGKRFWENTPPSPGPLPTIPCEPCKLYKDASGEEQLRLVGDIQYAKATLDFDCAVLFISQDMTPLRGVYGVNGSRVVGQGTVSVGQTVWSNRWRPSPTLIQSTVVNVSPNGHFTAVPADPHDVGHQYGDSGGPMFLLDEATLEVTIVGIIVRGVPYLYDDEASKVSMITNSAVCLSTGTITEHLGVSAYVEPA